MAFIVASGCPFGPARADSLQANSARPSVEMQRSVSKTRVGVGGSTTLLYRVENTGNVPVVSVKITDPLCGSVGEIELLNAGENRLFCVRVAITKPCASKPAASWFYGGLTYSLSLEPIDVIPAENLLTLSLSASAKSVTPGETVDFTLTLSNQGNTDLRSIWISEAALGELGELDKTLSPGETYEFRASAKVLKPGRYRFSAEADTSSDERITALSNEVAVETLPMDSTAGITLAASPESVRIDRPGLVSFTLRIENKTAEDIRDITVSEMNTGTVRTLAVLPPGVTTFAMECDIRENCAVRFLAEIADVSGGWQAVLSNETPVEIAPGGQTPGDAGLNRTELTGLGEPKLLSGGRPAYGACLYGGIAFLALMLLGAAANTARRHRVKKRRHNKRVRRMRRMRRDARMDEAEWVRTRPHKPIDDSGGEK